MLTLKLSYNLKWKALVTSISKTIIGSFKFRTGNLRPLTVHLKFEKKHAGVKKVIDFATSFVIFDLATH